MPDTAGKQANPLKSRFKFQSNNAEFFMTTTNAQAPVELKAEDLPAYCPNPNMPLWSSHPKVFLDMSHGGKANCPYCGTQYQLAPGTVIKGH
ncbi:hypothetical protein GCM10010946_18280 [Undibacterium squillarum]|uniref:Zinc finger CHCC-type domain-containing protein n=2 Tax=Undibacterium squillarum TaxID=1131567 RepID=A0ABQ2XZD6_9BURK|nr:hypothetical protein GCM10010946_18280 [Undibacterium squillarum]